MERLTRPGHECRQILGDQTGRAGGSTRTMQPNPCGSRFKRRHALGEQGRDGAGQDIARACGGE
jgi:hypothetical protein